MVNFILKRIGYMFLTLWLVTTITFGLMHAIPGDPLGEMAEKMPEQTKINYYNKYGIDQPIYVQYYIYLKNIVTNGDLGESMVHPGRTVTGIIKSGAPISGRLGIQALAMGVIIGSILGLIAAFNRNKVPDYLVMLLALLGVSVPNFVFASLLQYVFTVKWELLPTTGWEGLKYTILPSISLSLGSIAVYARHMRTSSLEVINQDYILTAKAKGVPSVLLVRKHVLRNATLPLITLFGPQLALVLTGSFVIERLFSIPGIGSYFVESVSSRDYTMIMGQTIFFASLYIFSLVAVDIVYMLVDPRIKLINDEG